MADLQNQEGPAKKAANIRVAVRCRPPIENELKSNTFEKLVVNGGAKGVSAWNERTNSYKNAEFDIVMDQKSTQGKIFEQAGMHEIVKHVADGYHATVFAYGQTGSGKTYTMEGYKYKSTQEGKAPQAQFDIGPETEGIVPRSIRLLYDIIKQQSNLQKKKFTVYCSYLQVYKEKIYDLLNKSHVKGVVSDGPGLKLKWNKNDIFSVENLYTFECKTIDDVMALYHFGIKNKVVASHNMNNSSSRSHSMLSLTVEQVDISNIDNVVVSKLQLVDLAGSERQSQTGNVANKESIDINKSLFTLRQVISALTDQQSKGTQHNSNQYVPYRDSKLTCLLRQSLGGNSFCLMIACLNPCDAQIEENISTMQYASQASYISNKPVRNDDPKARQIELLKEQVRRLTEELAKANDTIDFQSKLIRDNQQQLQANFTLNNQILGSQDSMLPQIKQDTGGSIEDKGRRDFSQSSQKGRNSRDGSLIEHRQIVTQRIVKDQEKVDAYFKEKADQIKNIASYQRQQNPHQPHSAANESKDAITERIVHTLNMMKEVLQGNLSLRATIQKQSEQIDDKNAEYFQLQQENEDLRERLTVLEEYTGKDSLAEVQKLVREKRQLENRVKHLEQTSNNWTHFQKTQQQFNKRGTKMPSQERRQATMDGEFNDDFEPVRPMMEHDDSQQEIESTTNQSYYDDIVPRKSLVGFNKSNSTVQHRQSAFDNPNVSGQKEFRVTTNQKQRNLNILNKQRSSQQRQPIFPAQTQSSTTSKAKFLKAPLNPNANSTTDRIKASQQMAAQKQIRAKTGKFVQQEKKNTSSAQQIQYMSRAQKQVHDNSTELLAQSLGNKLVDYKTSGQGRQHELHHSVDNVHPDQYYMEQEMSSYAQSNIQDNEYLARGIGGSGRQMNRKQAITVIDDHNNEPSRPYMMAERSTTPDNRNQIVSPSTYHEMTKTGSSQFTHKLPPRSPAKYQNQAQRQIMDHKMAKQVSGLASEGYDQHQEALDGYYDEEDEQM